ncbi:MAG: DivIVA domain-containing protein [Actinobacteria bacterium]|nr:DivIVA domain-containing protein [Actinomycetota bacterium]
MDQTAQLLIPDFNEKFRGYDIDEVDAFLLQVSGQLAELAREKDEAFARAAAAEDDLRRALEAAAAAPAPVVQQAPVASALESTTGEATRMLALASQTAERAVVEAKAEAARILSEASGSAEQTQREARLDADRIVGDARVSAEQMLQRATEQAAQEYGARRDEILGEIARLESNKTTSVTQLAAIESRIEEYRASLASISAHITELLDDPDKMLRPPIPGVDLPAPAQFIDVASRPAEGFPSVEQSPTSVVEPVVADVAQGRPAFVDDPAAAFDAIDGVVGAQGPAASAAPAYLDFTDDEVDVDPASFVVDRGFDEQRSGSESLSAATSSYEAVSSDSAAPAPDFSEAGRDDAAAGVAQDQSTAYSGFGDPDASTSYAEQSAASFEAAGWGDEAAPEGDAAVTQDSWAPGSWNEVAGFTTTDEAFSAPPQPDYGADAFGDADGDPVNRSTFPTGGLPELGADRYTRELDDALNTDDDDEAMARFFEGDEDRQTRRFGRRR